MNATSWNQLIFDLHYHRPIKLIKVSEEFFNHLETHCKADILDHMPEDVNGVLGEFTCIPIAVDNTLASNEYELVFEKEE